MCLLCEGRVVENSFRVIVIRPDKCSWMGANFVAPLLVRPHSVIRVYRQHECYEDTKIGNSHVQVEKVVRSPYAA